MDTDRAVSAPVRLISLDVLRGLVLLVMLFVNDLAGVRGVPAWMEHIKPSTADGMTFVDLVFPAFLFLVGVSIPFAIGSRWERGVPPGQIWRHILTRTASLLVIGVFMVNEETIAKDGPLPPAVWGLLMYTGVVLAWLTLPTKWTGKRPLLIAARGIGVALLVAAVLLYRGNGATGLLQMRPQWWGILGLIGWSYFGASVVYMLCRRNLTGVVGAVGLLYCVAIADAVGRINGLPGISWLTQWVSLGTVFGSQTAITVAGVALGMILTKDSPITSLTARYRWAFFYGLALGTAGILLHTAHDLNRVFIYNKNDATIPWCLVSSAVTSWLWIVASAATDLRPMRWVSVLVLAGQNALLAYILAPLFGDLLEILNGAGVFPFYHLMGHSFALGLWRSVLFAVGVMALAGLLQRRGVSLRL